ncbi:hypothetical protein [Solicola gregarius]|uniref:Uncharacterized protein n=1 Tax=Solicola gregarius TaxID=2908642 RepID=A0AA46TJQ8_9ACTN|nr:hypothetical protein [Solicola gregarius]UYM06393.1 hypothetical protein L0C25_04780 [Solicola gregarius]
MIPAQIYVQLADSPTADEVKPGWVALVIVLLMAVALAILMRSMVKQFRKVDFEEEPDERESSDPAADEHETNGSSH